MLTELGPPGWVSASVMARPTGLPAGSCRPAAGARRAARLGGPEVALLHAGVAQPGNSGAGAGRLRRWGPGPRAPEVDAGELPTGDYPTRSKAVDFSEA